MNFPQLIKWAAFAVDLKDNLTEIKKSLSEHSREIDMLRQQNLMLLQTIGQQTNVIQKLENRLLRLEDAVINVTLSRRSIGQATTIGETSNRSDSLDGPSS